MWTISLVEVVVLDTGVEARDFAEANHNLHSRVIGAKRSVLLVGYINAGQGISGCKPVVRLIDWTVAGVGFLCLKVGPKWVEL